MNKSTNSITDKLRKQLYMKILERLKMRNSASKHAQDRIKSLKTIVQKILDESINSSVFKAEEDSMYILNKEREQIKEEEKILFHKKSSAVFEEEKKINKQSMVDENQSVNQITLKLYV